MRVVSSHMPHTWSTSISLYVAAGSRYEPDEIAGISHFVEHMLFKGTPRRPLPKMIAEEIERVGGSMNAATDKEATVYWAKVGYQHFARTLDLFADMVLNSSFVPGEVEKERHVIVEELAETEDDPDDLAGLLLESTLYPAQPIGRDIGGSKETVLGISRQSLVDYVANAYSPDRTVLSVAGRVTHDEVMVLAHELFGGWRARATTRWFPHESAAHSRVGLRSKRTEQAKICLAVHSYPIGHPDRYALDVMNTALGEGMSSRLFLEIREHLALAYDVSSWVSSYRDTGYLAIGLGVDPKKADQALRACVDQLELLRDGIPDDELTKAREYIKGRIQLRMEDTRSVANWLGGQELMRDEILTVDDVVASIDAVTADDVTRVARDLIQNERMHVSVVGPFRSERRFAALVGA